MQLEEALLRIASLAWQEASESSAALEAVENWGRYDGLPPHLELFDDGRRARMLKPLGYTDPDGRRWDVPAGEVVDGASIPKPLWGLIGGPWSGPYRNASIVHDRYCVTKLVTWQLTHRMFYAAMRCSAVKRFQAKVMFYAVYRFGPRWPAPSTLEAASEGIEGVIAAPPMEPHADELAADAESIYAHDPSLEEIVALAETREAQSYALTMLETQGAEADKAQRARLLVIPGGRGTPEDCAVVAGEAASLPEFVLRHFERKKVRIVACQGSVTDFERDLRGVVPRGWDGLGKTWDDVPGTYFDDRKRVVVATVGNGVRAVPDSGSGLHGSVNLTVHESLHGYDYSSGHSALRDTAFIAARHADLGSLDAYQGQAGDAGFEETYAESGARYVSDAAGLRAGSPHLFGYWDRLVEPALETIGGERAGLESVADAAPLGVAVLSEGGAIELDLRAEGPGGAIGHAWFRFETGDPAYRDLLGRLYPEGIPEAGGVPAPVLFYGNRQ